MRTIIDGRGVVLSCGETDSLVAPEGGRVLEGQDATASLLSLNGDQECYWDGQGFQVRARALSADEVDRRDFRTLAQAALANWGSVTPDQKDRILKFLVRQALRGM